MTSSLKLAEEVMPEKELELNCLHKLMCLNSNLHFLSFC